MNCLPNINGYCVEFKKMCNPDKAMPCFEDEDQYNEDYEKIKNIKDITRVPDLDDPFSFNELDKVVNPINDTMENWARRRGE